LVDREVVVCEAVGDGGVSKSEGGGVVKRELGRRAGRRSTLTINLPYGDGAEGRVRRVGGGVVIAVGGEGREG